MSNEDKILEEDKVQKPYQKYYKEKYPKYFEDEYPKASQTYPFKCPACGEEFKDEKTFVEHWKDVHVEKYGQYQTEYYPKYSKRAKETDSLWERTLLNAELEVLHKATPEELDQFAKFPNLLKRKLMKVLLGKTDSE